MALVTERVSPDRWVPPWIWHQHLTRYEWVTRFTDDCVVIEGACGTGYGSALLATAGARQVDGFDLAPAAIQEAQERHGGPAVRFQVGDVTRLSLADQSYDVFVSLETIEHLPKIGPFRRRWSRPQAQGRFICSTPNRLLTNPGTAAADRPFNPYHVREYTRPEVERCGRFSPRSSSSASRGIEAAMPGFSGGWDEAGRHWP